MASGARRVKRLAMESELIVDVYFDGAVGPGPGLSGCGAALYVRGRGLVDQDSKDLGTATCNVAEWEGLILGVQLALLNRATVATFYGDSKLVVEQVMGRWKIKAGHLKPLAQRAHILLSRFERWRAIWIPREQNAVADELSKQAGRLPAMARL